MPTILVVDDEPDIRWILSNFLKAQGYEAEGAESGEEALAKCEQAVPDVILLDVRMPGLDGLQTLQRIRGRFPRVPVIMVTAYGDIPSAVQAMKLGAYDYLPKPFEDDDLVFTVRRALERQDLLGQVEILKSQLDADFTLGEIMGTSPQIKQVFRQIEQVARSTFTVIIQGETGTGKEVVARAVHEQSPRRERPFVALDCGAIPETLIESELFGYERGAFTGANRRKEGHIQLASTGTLFLDEITNLPLTTQSKLLRVLQERRVLGLGAKAPIAVDVRIIVATNCRLQEEMRAGRFRQDLFHRLNEFTIEIPPLRERREDIVDLAKRFLTEAKIELKKDVGGLSSEAVEYLLGASWPGNVRELRNTVRRASLLADDLIRPEHLAGLGSREAVGVADRSDLAIKAGLSLKEIVSQATTDMERQVIRRVLKQARGNKSLAARLLKVDYKTLHSKIKQYGISAREFIP